MAEGITSNDPERPRAEQKQNPLTVALVPWGDLIEDFLDAIEVSLESFAVRMQGGWLFGYIKALASAGIRTVVFCVSGRVSEPTRFVNEATGAAVWILPAPARYLHLRERIQDPYGLTPEKMFGKASGWHRIYYGLIHGMVPYTSTPLKEMARIIRKENCEVILCQEYEYARFDLCILLGRWINLPVFATFQGGNYHSSRLETILRPFFIHGAHGLLIGPDAERRRVIKQYAVEEGKIAQLFNPLDVHLWQALGRESSRSKYGLSPQTMVVGWHGRIDIHRKGLDVLMDAWDLVCTTLPHSDILLFLQGSGDGAGWLRERIGNPDTRPVRFLDTYVVDDLEIRSFLSAVDLYVFPSRHEGFPVAPLEAMACGLPVVATDAEGIPDIFEQGEHSGGLVVQRNDPIALAEALIALIEDQPRREEMSRHARDRIQSTFSVEAAGSQMSAFFTRRLRG